MAAERAGDHGERRPESKNRSGKAKPRHQEKVTYYCTAEALTRLEGARLILRADHDITCDRGRIIRAALADVLDDLEARGDKSALVRRLQARDESGDLSLL